MCVWNITEIFRNIDADRFNIPLDRHQTGRIPYQMMARWLTAFILLVILTGSVLAGASVFGGSQEGMSAMDCCKKKGMNVSSEGAARFC